ncbi:MAG: acyl-[acyl-carrier-protein] thioesterase [Saccharofermentanales bacterium]|jgi:medium-chain acyl-[acyl-carrier-protein] hydrolase
MAHTKGPSPYNFEILGTDTDNRDKLHSASLFSYMQEAAYYNSEYLGFGASELDKRGLCWLLLKISVRMQKLPSWRDTVSVDTWSRGAPRVLFLRDFRFNCHGETEPFGTAASEWLIADADTHRPQRPDKVFPDKITVANSDGVFSFACPKLPPLPAETEPVLKKSADFSDIDRNRHLNNTRYAAWAVDTLYAGAVSEEQYTIQGIDINYLSEVKFGEIINLCRLPVEAADLENMPPAAVIADSRALLIEGRRAADETVVFRCLLQYIPAVTAATIEKPV